MEKDIEKQLKCVNLYGINASISTEIECDHNQGIFAFGLSNGFLKLYFQRSEK